MSTMNILNENLGWILKKNLQPWLNLNNGVGVFSFFCIAVNGDYIKLYFILRHVS